MAAKYTTPKDLLFSSPLYTPTMVSNLANDAIMKIENGMLTATSNHNSPDHSENDPG